LRTNAGTRIFNSYHKEGEKNKYEVFVLRTNAVASSLIIIFNRMRKLIEKLFNPSPLRKAEGLVKIINEKEPEFENLSADGIEKKSQELRNKIKNGEKLDSLLPEAFALVRETSKRTLGQRHYNVQLLGGIVLHQGNIAEMLTGEGKTLASTAPIYLNALTGKGVHIVTVNDYLAKRDTVWMGQIYKALGVSTACLIHDGALIYEPRV